MLKFLTGIFCIIFLFAGAAVSAECEDVYMEGKLNINTASADALHMLHGINRDQAESIVAFRNASGPFSNVNDLIQVKGMSYKTIDQIRPFVKLQGNSTYAVQCFNPELWTKPRGVLSKERSTPDFNK